MIKHIFSLSVCVLFLWILNCIPALASGPGKVWGVVTEATSWNPVPYATVELLSSPDSALIKTVVAGEDGKYSFSDLAPGKYVLRISCLGYRKGIVPEFEISSRSPVVQFGPTALIAESKTLNEVTVIGHKLTGQITEGKTVYTISNRSAEIAQSGLELLRQLPDMTVNFMSDEVKLAGSNNLLFQVNGRKVDPGFLQQLNPALVERVEVTTNPGARYDSDVDAVINIVLKKNMETGISGRIRLQIPTSATLLNKNNGNVDLYYKKLRVYLSGNSKYSRYIIENESNRMNITPGEEQSRLTQFSSYRTKAFKAGFNYGFDWLPNDKNAFSFFSSVQPEIPVKNEVTTYNNYIHNLNTTSTFSTNASRDVSSHFDYSLFYKHTFDKDHEFSVENYYSSRNNIHSGTYKEQEYPQDGLPVGDAINLLNQHLENKNVQFVIKSDYMVPVSPKVKLLVGYNGYFIRSRSAYAERIVMFEDNIRYRESRQALYSNVVRNTDKLNLQLGGRYEFSDVDIFHESDTSNLYNYFLPSFSGVYTPGKRHTFRLNYRKSVIRPGIHQLSPIVYSDDSYLQSAGNPRLTPGTVNRIEFTHRIQIKEPLYVSYTPYLNFIRNDIRQVSLAVSDSVILRRYANVGRDIEYGLTVSGSVSPVKWLSISPSFTYFKRELRALPEYGIASNAERTSWRANISAQIMLPKNWVIFTDYNYYAPYIDLQTTSHAYYECVLGINKVVNKKLNVSVFTLNPWSNRYVYDNRTITSATTVQHSKESLKYSYIVMVSIGYRFKIGKEGKRLDRSIEQDESKTPEKGIL